MVTNIFKLREFIFKRINFLLLLKKKTWSCGNPGPLSCRALGVGRGRLPPVPRRVLQVTPPGLAFICVPCLGMGWVWMYNPTCLGSYSQQVYTCMYLYSGYKAGISLLSCEHRGDVISPSPPLISHALCPRSSQFISFFLYTPLLCPAPTTPTPPCLGDGASWSLGVGPEFDSCCTLCPDHFPERLLHRQ